MVVLRSLARLWLVTTLLSTPVSPAPVGAKQEDVGITELVTSLGEALHRADPRKLADLFAEDGRFTNVADETIAGRENIYRHHYKIWVVQGRPRTRSVNVLCHSTKMLTSDAAALEVRWDNKHSPESDGTRRPDRHGVWVAVATRKEGGWLFDVARNVMLNDGTRAIGLPIHC